MYKIKCLLKIFYIKNMITSTPSFINAHSSSQDFLLAKDQSSSDRFKQALKNNFILIATIIAVILGVSLAFVIRENVPLKPPQKAYFGFPGAIFLRMLRFLLLPLISSSLIIGIAGLGSGNAGRIAGRALLYFFVTTLISVAIGLVLVVSIKPGSRTKQNNSKPMLNPLNNEKITTVDTILDLIRNMFPDNMIQMTFQQYKTKLIPVKYTNSSEIDYWKTEASSASGINVLGIVIFCFLFGAVLCTMGESGRVLYDFFEALNVASLKIIGIIMTVSPLGIGSLVCGTILEMDDPWELFKSISFYIITLLTGLLFHGFIVLPLIFYLITKRNVFSYTYNMLEALIMAFATASSSATLPISFKCVEEKNKVSKMISKFVLPVGATSN
jgi:solute carrier family 1 (neuronal/epithelial high affinity glutamate transporter), member 1